MNERTKGLLLGLLVFMWAANALLIFQDIRTQNTFTAIPAEAVRIESVDTNTSSQYNYHGQVVFIQEKMLRKEASTRSRHHLIVLFIFSFAYYLTRKGPGKATNLEKTE